MLVKSHVFDGPYVGIFTTINTTFDLKLLEVVDLRGKSSCRLGKCHLLTSHDAHGLYVVSPTGVGSCGEAKKDVSRQD